MYLRMHPDNLVTIGEIADAYRVPRNHLMKVVHRLATLGYVETIRGNRGGMRLARNSGLITVGAVIRDMEEKINTLDCFDLKSNDADCPLLPTCALRAALMQARDNFLSTLDAVTLNDLVSRGKGRTLVWPSNAPSRSGPRRSNP